MLSTITFLGDSYVGYVHKLSIEPGCYGCDVNATPFGVRWPDSEFSDKMRDCVNLTASFTFRD